MKHVKLRWIMVICKNSEDKKSGKREKNLRQKRPRPARAEGGED